MESQSWKRRKKFNCVCTRTYQLSLEPRSRHDTAEMRLEGVHRTCKYEEITARAGGR